jgi:hypothetical protein
MVPPAHVDGTRCVGSPESQICNQKKAQMVPNAQEAESGGYTIYLHRPLPTALPAWVKGSVPAEKGDSARAGNCGPARRKGAANRTARLPIGKRLAPQSGANTSTGARRSPWPTRCAVRVANDMTGPKIGPRSPSKRELFNDINSRSAARHRFLTSVHRCRPLFRRPAKRPPQFEHATW